MTPRKNYKISCAESRSEYVLKRGNRTRCWRYLQADAVQIIEQSNTPLTKVSKAINRTFTIAKTIASPFFVGKASSR